ncbi:MAG: type II toxin-antitoxin system PemK/MazF family toxin [Spirochaetaceae bacterium]|jgi:mRNA interferase MazF|nr:type II toxin-antitoxin system PemK/MazF family toxin [Spirochaetaceae bacterium]
MIRGEVWWADFGIPLGSEPGYRRPVVIIQADFLNNSRFQTVLSIPLTTNMIYADMPGNVYISKAESGLSKDSVAITPQIYPLDRSQFVERAGKVSTIVLQQLIDGLSLVMEND